METAIYYNEKQLDRLVKKIAENRKEFVAIVGAGLSRAAGLPLWEELKDELIDQLENKYKGVGSSPENENTLARLRRGANYWTVFEELKQELGEHDYETLIKDRLRTKPNNIPENYRLLWEIGISGVITFNLDKLLLDSYSKVYSAAPNYATAKEPHKYKNFLSESDPFILHAHGIVNDASSWIMTRSERTRLYRNPDFLNFMAAILNNKNLIILGFNPMEDNFLSLLDDIGIKQAISGSDNYCIMPDVDISLDRLFQKSGFSAIGYYPKDKEKHLEVTELLEQLCAATPSEEEAPTVYDGEIFTEADIPSRAQMGNYSNDQLRKILNGVVAGIIPADSVPSEREITDLQDFYKKYNAQLHMAWLIDHRNEQDNKLLGYTITDEIGRGSFGQVYEAYDSLNNKYAIKVLLPEIREKISYLNCFRRGTRAMRILKEHSIEGMVKIHAAFEVPACIVMDYVEGPTLRDAIDQQIITDIHDKLEIIKKISTITHSAHQLEERILHRDLKPENIILDNYYMRDTDQPIPITILDFDLAWHRDATERTVFLGGLSQGFMAPEQIDSEQHSLTRNAAVDVYSIGMLLYYVLCGKNPMPNQHEFRDFKERIVEQIKERYRFEWKLLPEYLAETIVKATYHKQDLRLALSVFIERIKLAEEMNLNHLLPNMHPLLLSELAKRIDPVGKMEASDFDRNVFVKTAGIDKEVHLRYCTENYRTYLEVKLKKSRGEADRRNIAKFLATAKEKALAKVNNLLFYRKDAEIQTSALVLVLRANLPDKVSLDLINKLSNNILEVRSVMDLS